jgi:glycosyltransferase involved in cell wall biosynthesis
MPVRDGARFLDPAIASVLGQDLRELELLVVDDGSRDATPAILARWADLDSRVRVVRLPAREGVAVALNRGLHEARCALVACMDADDVMLPGRLRAQANALEREPDVVLLAAGREIVDARGRWRYCEQPVGDRELLSHVLAFSNPLGHGTVMYRRSAVLAAGGYDPSLEASVDYELWHRLAAAGRMANLPQLVLRTRMHDQRISVRLAPQQQRRSLATSRRALTTLLGRDPGAVPVRAAADVWRATGRRTDSRAAHRVFADALAAASLARGTRWRVRRLTAERWAISALQQARAGHGGDAVSHLVYALRWHPAGVADAAVALGRRQVRRARSRAPRVASWPRNFARPRALFVIASLQRGGSEGQLVELVTRGAKNLDSTVVVTGGGIDPLHGARLARAGIPVHLAGSRPRDARAPARLVRWISTVRPDVVYAWGETATLFAAPGALRAGVPLAIARRRIGGEGGIRDAVAQRLERAADIVTANSRAVADDACARGVDPQRIMSTRNGHGSGRDPEPPPTGTPVMGYVAGLRPGKGHDRLLAALTRLPADVRWRADLAGDGPLREELRRAINDARLAERVRCVGTVDDVRAFWRNRHIAVLLSDSEGSPNALIEAGLAGRPIVGTLVPGIEELITPRAGFLVAPDDPEAVSAALTRLIEDSALRERLGAGARERMLAFGTDDMLAEHLAALRMAMALR